jgi:hypothetical protein
MSTKFSKSAVNPQAPLPLLEMPLLKQVEEMGRDRMKQSDEEDAETNPLDYYGEWYMEDLSEAGYTETPSEARLSTRAFGQLLRIKPDELAKVKSCLRYRRTAYHDFALADTAIDALSRNQDVAAALALLKPSNATKIKGPFQPQKQEFELLEALKTTAGANDGQANTDLRVAKYLLSKVWLPKPAANQLSAADRAAVQLAGLIRIKQSDLSKVAAKLIEAGANTQTALQVSIARVVLSCLSVTPRLVAGLQRAQPRSTE